MGIGCTHALEQLWPRVRSVEECMHPGTSIEAPRREAAQRALALDDAALLAECEEEFFVAGGPGGQHRNKTASGVRLTHPPTELSVTATERRSQTQNRGVALERLRVGLRALATVPRQRRKTRPTRASVSRRLEEKRRRAEKKRLRGTRRD
jgi:ribosome-associated protein